MIIIVTVVGHHHTDMASLIRVGIHTKVATGNVVSTFLCQTHPGKKRRTVADTYRQGKTIKILASY